MYKQHVQDNGLLIPIDLITHSLPGPAELSKTANQELAACKTQPQPHLAISSSINKSKEDRELETERDNIKMGRPTAMNGKSVRKFSTFPLPRLLVRCRSASCAEYRLPTSELMPRINLLC